MESEAELIASARRYSFRARMDGKSQGGEIAGPVRSEERRVGKEC